MRIAVFGAGGVGGYFGGRLAQSGEHVIFIARGAHLHAMQTQGLRVDSIAGDFYLPKVEATDTPAHVGVVDVILVAVKAWQVPEAALAMRPMVGTSTAVIPLENGVEAPAQLREVLGEGPVLGGLCQISAHVHAPGHIRHVGVEPYIAFGELDGRPSQRAMQLLETFRRAGVKAEVPEDILAAMWRKFTFIASISGVGAVTRAPVGVVRSLPETRAMLIQAIEEVVAVARARQVNLPEDIVTKTLAFIDQLAPTVLASMQRDIMEGKPSELEAQNGAVVRMGKEAGVHTPTHTFIYASLLPQERKARQELNF